MEKPNTLRIHLQWHDDLEDAYVKVGNLIKTRPFGEWFISFFNLHPRSRLSMAEGATLLSNSRGTTIFVKPLEESPDEEGCWYHEYFLEFYTRLVAKMCEVEARPFKVSHVNSDHVKFQIGPRRPGRPSIPRAEKPPVRAKPKVQDPAEENPQGKITESHGQ